MTQIPDQPGESRQRINTSGTGWAGGVLVGVVLLILLSYVFGNNTGWAERDRIAHMTPPMASSDDGPATRTWRPTTP